MPGSSPIGVEPMAELIYPQNSGAIVDGDRFTILGDRPGPAGTSSVTFPNGDIWQVDHANPSRLVVLESDVADPASSPAPRRCTGRRGSAVPDRCRQRSRRCRLGRTRHRGVSGRARAPTPGADRPARSGRPSSSRTWPPTSGCTRSPGSRQRSSWPCHCQRVRSRHCWRRSRRRCSPRLDVSPISSTPMTSSSSIARTQPSCGRSSSSSNPRTGSTRPGPNSPTGSNGTNPRYNSPLPRTS